MILIFSLSSRKKDSPRRAVSAWIVRSTPRVLSDAHLRRIVCQKRLMASVRCPRCGKLSATADKFCAECGRFLRDASIDQRLLLAAGA